AGRGVGRVRGCSWVACGSGARARSFMKDRGPDPIRRHPPATSPLTSRTLQPILVHMFDAREGEMMDGGLHPSPSSPRDVAAPDAAVRAACEIVREVAATDLDTIEGRELVDLLANLDETSRLVEA